MKLFNKRPRRCTLCRHRARIDAHANHTNPGPAPLYMVQCPDCGRHTWDFPERAQAVAAWNCMA